MAYTPINWDEITPITPANLNKMDGQIDTNENDLRTIQGGEAAVDGRISNNESDINDIENGTTKVPNASTADNALALQGEGLEVVNSGTINVSANSDSSITLLDYNAHYKYFYSAYTNGNGNVAQVDSNFNDLSCFIEKGNNATFEPKDALVLRNKKASSVDFNYKVWVLR